MTGIYWVYFEFDNGHEMKLQVDAKNNKDAEMIAKNLASVMYFNWQFKCVVACR